MAPDVKNWEHGEDRGCSRPCARAIVVHPNFRHTLPEAKPATPPRYWDRLPIEVLHVIVSHLQTAREVCQFEGINQACRAAACDQRIWRRLCSCTFTVPPYANPSSWKELYRELRMIQRVQRAYASCCSARR